MTEWAASLLYRNTFRKEWKTILSFSARTPNAGESLTHTETLSIQKQRIYIQR